MSALKSLQAASTLNDVAHLLGFKPKALAYLIRGMHPGLRYSQFDIPKRSGGKRTISAPNKRLKLLQKRLARHLHLCEVEIEAVRGVKRRLAHGFKKGQSILTNADVHRKRRYVLNIDLENFFGTINFGRVRGFLIKNKDFLLKPDVATVIAQIACHNNALPQGSPCSPVLSNLIANVVDIRLAKLGKANGCSYTRYADDITFSTSMKVFPADLAVLVPGSLHLWMPGKALEKAIDQCGFTINKGKTRLQYRRSRQDVTGIIVNKQVNTRTEYRRTLRAMVHRLCTTGTYDLQQSQLILTGETKVVTKPGSLAQLEGMLNFARHVEIWRQRSNVPPPVELTPSERLLREFLFYKNFAGTKQPTVLFEGKTDSIYLREALRRLAFMFPSLVTPASTPLKLQIKLHRYTATMGKLFGLKGGTGPLHEFIKRYPEDYQRIKGPKGEYPIVVLIDNDSGASGILNLVEQKFKMTLTPGQYYFHVVGNLYVMLTSPKGGPPHFIENCFDADTRATPLSGKLFNPSNNFNQATEYGKAWFAEKVVKAKSATIDFTGFTSLLTALTALVDAHTIKVVLAKVPAASAPKQLALSAPLPQAP